MKPSKVGRASASSSTLLLLITFLLVACTPKSVPRTPCVAFPAYGVIEHLREPSNPARDTEILLAHADLTHPRSEKIFPNQVSRFDQIMLAEAFIHIGKYDSAEKYRKIIELSFEANDVSHGEMALYKLLSAKILVHKGKEDSAISLLLNPYQGIENFHFATTLLQKHHSHEDIARELERAIANIEFIQNPNVPDCEYGHALGFISFFGTKIALEVPVAEPGKSPSRAAFVELFKQRAFFQLTTCEEPDTAVGTSGVDR